MPGFDGNTEAIEKLISKRELLAFSDDELRNSSALLVTSTKDLKEAEDLQALAMDLARSRGSTSRRPPRRWPRPTRAAPVNSRRWVSRSTTPAIRRRCSPPFRRRQPGRRRPTPTPLAGKWQALQIKFQNMMEVVGAKLIPVFAALVDFSLNWLIPAIER